MVRETAGGDAGGPAPGALEAGAGSTPRAADAPPADQVDAGSEPAASDLDHGEDEGEGARAPEPSDRSVGPGGETGVTVGSLDGRDWSAAEYRKAARERLERAAARDAVAQRRDAIAAARDQLAAARDATAEIAPPSDEEALIKAVASARTSAAEIQARAATDRALAVRDREQAARDRLEAQADIQMLLLRLAMAETDALSGIRARLVGLADLQREIDRAGRTSRRLVIAYVAVVGFKAVIDAYGPAAGEALLQRVLRTIRSQLRSYDGVVRLGGGEFLCMMPGARLQAGHHRLAAIRSALATGRDQCEITYGFAELKAHDGAVELIHRAEIDLAATPRGSTST